MLDLLQHGVGQPVGKSVPGEQQNRQAIGHRHACGSHHIGGAWTDRGSGHHDLPPPRGLCEPYRGKGHGLLVLATPGRQPILHLLESFRKAGHIAMTENAEKPGKQRHMFAIDLGELIA